MLTIEKGAYVTVACEAEGCKKLVSLFTATPKRHIEVLKKEGWQITRHRKGAATALCPDCVELQAKVDAERVRLVAESRAKRDAAQAEHKALLAKAREGGE